MPLLCYSLCCHAGDITGVDGVTSLHALQGVSSGLALQVDHLNVWTESHTYRGGTYEDACC